ncbi:MAG: PAS domain S-box protein [Nitrosopumilales archaeon]|nr:PAS domain S-box protein [Nitrosopumilales archaeon]
MTYVNEKFCKISKYSQEELLGQNPRILKSGFHLPQFYQNLWHTISGGKVWKGVIKKQGKRWLLLLGFNKHLSLF